jgi:hypothetical protein
MILSRRSAIGSSPYFSPPAPPQRHRLAGRQMSATIANPSEAEVGMAQKTWEIEQ